ncbi:MAG: decaprenyl-phosphate phosphoribosyltransferase [Myxococcota bacterium]|nr:decaprenyl-phosphate phosphoribosyltransferase [Myxococcota bacterium]
MTEPTSVAPSPGQILKAAIRALRPKQWAKQVFLFAALIFSLEFTNPETWIKTVIGAMAFSMLSSTGYIFNDARDVEADRVHPTKRNRPIASGHLPLPIAYAQMVLIFSIGVSLAWFLSPKFLIVALLYFITTISYSFYFKHLVILDVMFLAACYLWRAAAGAVAIGVTISPWLLTCTAFISLFLGFNKRRGELLMLQQKGSSGVTRKNLAQYSPELVVEFQAIATSGTIISYALYAVLGSPTPWMLLTLPYVLYGIFRYIYLVSIHSEGGAPDETLLKDRPILVTGILYAITAVIVLSLHMQGALV